MVGLVVATHGRLGEELLATAGAVCGPLDRARAVSISAAQAVEVSRALLAEAIREADDGDGVLVLTDMLVGTPANLALTFLEDARVEVVTGVNLPMLLKLSTLRAEGANLQEAAALLPTYGQKNITLASQLLRAKSPSRPPAT
jgi:PTS system mannose-specific IIA component